MVKLLAVLTFLIPVAAADDERRILLARNVTVAASATMTTTSIRIIAANPQRIGLLLYNNSGNSAYIKYGSSGDSANNMSFILGANANWVMPQPVFTGELWGKRNSGTGTVVATELTR